MRKREIPIEGDNEADMTSSSTDTSAQTATDGGGAASREAESSERLTTLEEENRQLREQLLRTMADLENVRRRSQQERMEMALYANERLLQNLLPIVDDLRRSVESGEKTRDYDVFYKGVSMIYDKAMKLLEQNDVRRIESIGQTFDVEHHDALMRQASDAPEDTVITEVEPGYMYGDKILRHAKVIVSAGN